MKNQVVNVRFTKEFDLYIGREIKNEHHFFEKSKWHNPFKSKDHPNQNVLELYRNYILASELYKDLNELDGLILGCWCKPNNCHGDVLVQLMNEKKMQDLIGNTCC